VVFKAEDVPKVITPGPETILHKKEAIPEGVKQRIINKIRPLIAKQLGVNEDKVSLDSKFKEDLGADSLDAIEVIMALEEAYSIEIMDEDAEKMFTVEDIVVYLAGRGIS